MYTSYRAEPRQHKYTPGYSASECARASGLNGDWNHWSNAAGGAVGGSADGCIYTTFGWSNC